MSTATAPTASLAPSDSLLPEAPLSDLDTFLGSTVAPPSSAASPLVLAWDAACQWLAFFRGLTLAAGSALSAAVAGGGLAVLLFLAVVATLAPASDTFARPLTLDFGRPDLAGEAVFLPEGHTPDGLPPATLARDARFLAPQQGVDVWAELTVPRTQGAGVAQVVAQLASLDGRVAGKASKVVSLGTDRWSPSSLVLAPLRWLGLASSVRKVRVPLFHNYKEKQEVPFMVASVAVKTRNPACAPEVLAATLKVQLRLGWLRRLAYMARPGQLALPLLGAAAAAALLGGGAAALVFLLLLAFMGFTSSATGAPGGGADDVASVAGSEEVEVSSVSGVSEASSSMLRELSEDEGEPPSPRAYPGALDAAPSGSRRRVAAEQWYDPLPEAANVGARAAAAGSGAGAAKLVGGAGGRPADSAMGSEPGGSLQEGLLRRRGGAT